MAALDRRRGAGGHARGAGGHARGAGGHARGAGGHARGAAAPFCDSADGIHTFLTFDYHLGPADIARVAPRTDFVWGARPDHVAAWHAANPRVFVSRYLPFDEDPDARSLDQWRRRHPDWIVYRCDRVTPVTQNGYPNLDLDIANPAVRAFQLAYVRQAAAAGYDGIAFDLFQLDNDRGACGVYRGGRWVQRYNGTRDDARYTADVLAWLRAMYAALHRLPRPMGLVVNYVQDRDDAALALAALVAHVDGVLDELGFGNWNTHLTGADWARRMRFADRLQRAGKAYFAVSGFPPGDARALPWVVASYMMANQQHAALFLAATDQYGGDAWRAPFAAPVGHPCGPREAAGDLYRRVYSRALALVNPSATRAATVRLPADARYTDLAARPVAGTITLGPHEGAVLLRAGAPGCR